MSKNPGNRPSRTSLFDLQVNGFGGLDYQKEGITGKALRDSCDALRRHEMDRIFLTLISDDVDALCRKLENFESLRRADAVIGETIAGYHIEGPFLSSEEGYRGAHPKEKMKAPDLKELALFQEAAGGNVRLVTIAPEWPGSDEFIARATADGIVISLGHTNADDDAIDRAIRAGATLCTHLGNGCPAEMHRHDNIIQRLLARDELIACVIPDGIHVPAHAMKNLYRAKPKGKFLLTTDAMAAAGAPPGRYTIGRLEIEVGADGVVREPGMPNFAGSSLTLDRGVANFAEWAGVPVEDAREMASTKVAALFGIDLPETGLPAATG